MSRWAFPIKDLFDRFQIKFPNWLLLLLLLFAFSIFWIRCSRIQVQFFFKFKILKLKSYTFGLTITVCTQLRNCSSDSFFSSFLFEWRQFSSSHLRKSFFKNITIPIFEQKKVGGNSLFDKNYFYSTFMFAFALNKVGLSNFVHIHWDKLICIC